MKSTPLVILILLTSFLVIIYPNSLLANEKKQTKTQSEYIQLNAQSLANVKESLNTGKAKDYTKNAYRRLIKDADKTLKKPNLSVMDKTFFPPSNDKHDYLSISRYWWPDPASTDGLPWLRKDGLTNPKTQTDDVDRNRLGLTMKAIRTLSLAYYFSEDEKYAQKTISIIKTWFLDAKTKMNPHLTYAQSVPGNPKGRRSGILDGRMIPEVVLDAITMLSKSPAWTPEIAQQMHHWLREYLSWLTTSKLGLAGAQQKNNHGSWYRFQVASLAWYLNDEKLLKQAITDAQQSLPEQFNKQGAQEHELARTRGFFYSCFNLQALANVAAVAEKGDLSLWNYTSPEGRNLTLAIDYLMPVTRGEKWPHASKKIELSRLAAILADMLPYTDDPQYHQTLRKILKDLGNKEKLSSNEKKVYYSFALLRPELM